MRASPVRSAHVRHAGCSLLLTTAILASCTVPAENIENYSLNNPSTAELVGGGSLVITNDYLAWDIVGDRREIAVYFLGQDTYARWSLQPPADDDKERDSTFLSAGTNRYLVLESTRRSLFGRGSLRFLDLNELGTAMEAQQPFECCGRFGILFSLILREDSIFVTTSKAGDSYRYFGDEGKWGFTNCMDSANCLAIVKLDLVRAPRLTTVTLADVEDKLEPVKLGYILDASDSALYYRRLKIERYGKSDGCGTWRYHIESGMSDLVRMDPVVDGYEGEPLRPGESASHGGFCWREFVKWPWGIRHGPSAFPGIFPILPTFPEGAPLLIRNFDTDMEFEVPLPPSQAPILGQTLIGETLIYVLSSQLYRLQLKPGAVPELLTFSPGNVQNPVSNGKWLAWIDDARGGKDVWLMNWETQEAKCLTCELEDRGLLEPVKVKKSSPSN